MLRTLQVVDEFVGYTARVWTLALYRLLVVLTGGLLWPLTQYSPSANLWSLQECHLSLADYVHVQVSRFFVQLQAFYKDCM